MKSLVKVLLSVVALGLLASAPMLRAQDPATPPPADGGGKKGGKGKGGGMLTVERIEAAVGTLTDDQKTKIGDLLKKAGSDMQALRDGGGDPQTNRPKMQEINKKLHDDIRAVLTADQQAKFDAMPQPGRGKKGGGGN